MEWSTFLLFLSRLSIILWKFAWILLILYYVQVEKRKLFHIFLKQFLTIFRSWKPFNPGKTPDEALTVLPVECARNIGDVVVGCNFGHPAEVILILTEEVAQITRLLTDSKLLTYYYAVDENSCWCQWAISFSLPFIFCSSSIPWIVWVVTLIWPLNLALMDI